MRFRMNQATTLEEKLFVLMSLGDDRTVCETYIYGELAHHTKGEQEKRLVS
jgi:guanine deaminase